MNTESLSWAAGAADFGLRLVRHPRSRGLSLTHPERECVERFARIVDAGRITGPYGTKGSYRWKAGVREGRTVLEKLRPYVRGELYSEAVELLSVERRAIVYPGDTLRERAAAFANDRVRVHVYGRGLWASCPDREALEGFRTFAGGRVEPSGKRWRLGARKAPRFLQTFGDMLDADLRDEIVSRVLDD